VHLVEVLVEEDGDLEQRPGTEPRDAYASVALQAEERPETLLAAPRRAELDREVRLVVAGVRERVHGSGRDDEERATPQAAPAEAHAEPQLARDPLEALPLIRVHVRWHVSAGPDEQLGADPARRPFAEDDALARYGIRDRIYHEAEQLI
jgi:hypothetical protein